MSPGIFIYIGIFFFINFVNLCNHQGPTELVNLETWQGSGAGPRDAGLLSTLKGSLGYPPRPWQRVGRGVLVLLTWNTAEQGRGHHVREPDTRVDSPPACVRAACPPRWSRRP